jgi:hypothetical protein
VIDFPIFAIPTEWEGYRFRSRLEARWSIFFKRIGIEFQYEPEGVILSDGTWYLPDFFLPRVNMWAEVMWLELKRIDPRGRRTKASQKQKEWHTLERKRGALTLIAGFDFEPTTEGFRTFYKNSGLMRNKIQLSPCAALVDPEAEG